MKTKFIKITCLLITGILFLHVNVLCADTVVETITISGVVKDSDTQKPIANVNVSVPSTGVGTVTNADGIFSIKVKSDLNAKELEFIYIGYANAKLPLSGNDEVGKTIYLVKDVITLSEVMVYSGDATELVKTAISKIGDNYSNRTHLLTAFYRETVRKRRNYISVSESINDIYKLPYSSKMDNVDNERVQIIKGRKLISPKLSDTLGVKLQGGPNLAIYLDVVKNPNLMLDSEHLGDFRFRVDGYIMLNNRQHYIVSFTPQVTYSYPLHEGKLFIDVENLTISRAEFNLEMKDLNKVTQAVLKKKPANLRFKPENVSFLVSYKQIGGKSYISYVRNEIEFKCDWKRKLFSTNYAVISEMVVIDEKHDETAKIPYKQAFKMNQTFSDKVSDFYDADFWKDYNIIEPTESLESAVNKLKKQYK